MQAIPGEVQLTTAEIEEAVSFINERISDYVYKGSIEIGNYILEKFFNNDLDLVLSKNRQRPSSFLQLCRHQDLAVSYSTIINMVKVAAQERFLVQEEIETDLLKYSHKVELLRLPNNKEKLDLARACIESSWSIRELKSRVQQALESMAIEDQTGTAPFTQVIRYVRRVNRWSKRAEAPEVLLDPEIIHDLDPQQKLKLRRQASKAINDLASIHDVLVRLVEQLNEEAMTGEETGTQQLNEPQQVVDEWEGEP